MKGKLDICVYFYYIKFKKKKYNVVKNGLFMRDDIHSI